MRSGNDRNSPKSTLAPCSLGDERDDGTTAERTSRLLTSTGLIDSRVRATDWLPLDGAVARSALIRCLPSIKRGRVPPPYKKQARGTSPIIFLPTTYGPTFPGFSPPLAWHGRTVGISTNARASIGCQLRLTRMPPLSKIVSKKREGKKKKKKTKQQTKKPTH